MSKKVRYGKGKAQGYRGLGDVHSEPFNVPKSEWDRIFNGGEDAKKESYTERIAAKK